MNELVDDLEWVVAAARQYLRGVLAARGRIDLPAVQAAGSAIGQAQALLYLVREHGAELDARAVVRDVGPIVDLLVKSTRKRTGIRRR